MNNTRWVRHKRAEHQPEPATISGPKPGDFPICSQESRVAARGIIDQRKELSGPGFVVSVRFVGQVPQDSESWISSQRILGTHVRIEYAYDDDSQ